MERENLAGDAKGKGTSGSNREAESLDSLDEQRRLRSAVAKVPTVIAVTNDKRWRHQYLMIGFGRLVWCA
jgi:hypothetical protein